MSQGIGNLATEFRFRDADGNLLGALLPIDYAKSAAGYGAKTYTARNLDELREALIDSKKQTVSTLIDIKVLPKTMTNGYGAWWRTGTAQVAAKESVREANRENQENIKKARQY